MRLHTVASVLNAAQAPVNERVVVALVRRRPDVNLGMVNTRTRVGSFGSAAGRISCARLAIYPDLNRATGCVLVGNRCVGRNTDSSDRKVLLILSSACTSDVFQQVDGIYRKRVDRLVFRHSNRALLDSPEVYATVRPFNRQQVEAAPSGTQVVTGAQLLPATLESLFNDVVEVEVE